MMDSPRRYDAFISYSRHDLRAARWLQKHIQTRKLPPRLAKRLGLKRKRLDRIFRDETDLAGHHTLSGALREALERSSHLIVICSPYAAASPYVEEEIRYFQSLGRADRILCVIAGGDPEDPGPLNCFPPTLGGDQPPLAADLRKDADDFPETEGDRIVAALLGISLRELQADELRQRRRRVQAVAMAATFCLVALGAGWDWTYRAHVTYARHLVDVAGAWEGRGPLSATDAGARGSYYALYRRGHSDVPHRIELRNGASGRPYNALEGLLGEESLRDCHAQGAYTLLVESVGDRVTEERWLNPDGLEYEKVIYPDSTTIGEFREGAFGCSRTPSGIRYIRQLYDARGFETRRWFLNETRETVPNEQGVYGYAFTRDDAGLPLTVRNLGPDGEYWPNDEGIYAMQHDRDERGEILRTRFLGLDGTPVRGPSGCAILTFERDDVGNPIREACRDGEGRPALSEQWTAVIQRQYDDNGNVVEVSYFDTAGHATLNREWVARTLMRHDKHGNVVEARYYDADGEPTRPRGLSPVIRSEFDERGRNVGHSHFDETGAAVLDVTDGHHAEVRTLDELGRRIRTANFDVDGSPMANKVGVHASAFDWDDRGLRKRVVYLGADGQGVFSTDGYAGFEDGFDARGNGVSTHYLGPDGAPAARTGGLAAVISAFDAAGNEVAVRYLGPDGEPDEEGFAFVDRVHDGRGRVVRQMFLSADSTPAALRGGHSGWTRAYDESGRIVREEYLDGAGNRMTLQSGQAAIVFEYDAAGNRTRETYLDLQDRPALLESGYAAMVWTYDARGLQLTETLLDEEGRPRTTGIARYVSEYDERGQRVRHLFLDAEGRPVSGSSAYAGFTSVYDDRGNVIEEAYLGVDEAPGTNANGVGIVRFRYDRRDHRVEQAYFTVDGEPVEGSDGIQAFRDEYDELGRHLVRRYIDANGQPTVAVWGYAGRRQSYDERHLEIQRVYFGLDGQPVLRTGADPRRAVDVHRYDRHGRLEYLLFYDTELQAVPLGSDDYGTLHLFDENGRRTGSTPLTRDLLVERGLLRHSLR